MAKTKQIIRSSIKSFFEKHTDPEKHDKLEATRKDMEEKKTQILNLVQNEEDKDESKRGTLSELIEDFHKQYESLYAQYDHLTGELKNNVHKRQHENGNSSSSSDSDSDSDSSSDSDDSSKKKSIKKVKLRGEALKATEGLKQELEAAKDEIALLKNKFESAERAITDLKVETKTLNSEKLNLLAEKEDLSSKLKGFVEIEVDLKQQIDELIREKEGVTNLKAEEQIKALEEQNDSLKLELEIIMREKREIEERFEGTGTDAGKTDEVNENDSNAKIEALTARVNDFTEEVKKLHAEKSRLEEQRNELEGNFQESRANLETAGSEIERLTQQLTVAVKKTSTVEFQVLMAKQKLRITEQLLAEKEEDYKMAVTKFQDECKILEDKNASLSIALAANEKVYRGIIKNMSENMNKSIAGLECITRKFEDDNEKLSGRIYSMSEEIQSMKHFVPGKNIDQQNLEERVRNLAEELQNERERGLIIEENLSKLQIEVGKEKEEKERLLEALTELKKRTQEQNLEERVRNLTEELQNERERELIIEENLSKLQIEVGKEKEEKERLLEALTELKKTTQEQNLEERVRNLAEELQNERERGLIIKENLSKLQIEVGKEKEEKERLLEALTELKKTTQERVAILEHEKREAIRQMCLWSDNLQSRYDELKDMVVKSYIMKTVV